MTFAVSGDTTTHNSELLFPDTVTRADQSLRASSQVEARSLPAAIDKMHLVHAPCRFALLIHQ